MPAKSTSVTGRRKRKISAPYNCFLVDIYATQCVSDLVNMLGKAVLEELKPKGRNVWEKFITDLSSIRSEISFDINGMPSWSMGLGEIRNPIATLDEIFKYLQNAGRPCIVAIDEFQQITKYGDSTVEATLRTYVQKTTNAHLIFSGSQRHLMNGMFTSPSRPFYQGVTIINLKPLEIEKYIEFTVDKFEKGGKKFDPTIDFVIRLSSDTYESLFYQMPQKQRAVFLAIAAEEKATEVMGGAFVKRHGLVSASSVSSGLKGLLDKDFITNDNGAYSVYDKLFQLWLSKRGLI